MKKVIFLIILLVTTFYLIACGSNGNIIKPANSSEDAPDTKTEDPRDNIYGIIQGDWPIYQNAQELVEKANLVFTGRVTGISFQMLDLRDIETIGDEIGDWHYDLYTLYDVDILTPYKGEVMQSIQIRMMGGLMDYQVDEQLQLLAQYNKEFIPILEEHLEYKIGEEYLFVLYQYKDITPTPVNLSQGSYNLRNPFEKHTINSTILDESYYTKKVDDLGNPILSAKDIILTFGQEKWDSYWEQWKVENPEWETWIDKEVVKEM